MNRLVLTVIIIAVCSWQIITSVWFSIRFCKKNWGFRFSLGFYQIDCTFRFFSGSVFTFFRQRHLSFTPLRYDARNDVLLCWVGPTICQLKWLGTRSAEIWHEEKYFESFTVDPIMLEDKLWMRQCEKLSPNRQSQFLFSAETEFSFFYTILRLVQFTSVFRNRTSYPLTYLLYIRHVTCCLRIVVDGLRWCESMTTDST